MKRGIFYKELVGLLVFLLLLINYSSSYAQTTTRTSVDSFGNEGWGDSFNPSISPDGRYVAFESRASLVLGDYNGVPDIFVHDTLTGETTRVSVDSFGNETWGDSVNPSISSDGRYVAFESWADNLVPGDTNFGTDIFVHDTLTGETIRVSVDSFGNEAWGLHANPSISSDGRYVAFESTASSLVPGDTNNASDIFIKDTVTGQTVRVSVDSSVNQGNGGSYKPSISLDGRYVSFESVAANLVIGDTNGVSDIFVHDTLTGQTTRVSVDSDGYETFGGSSNNPSISSDGRYVAFESSAFNLVPGDINYAPDIFVHDTLTGQTVRVSVDTVGIQGDAPSLSPSISPDGSYVAFESYATNLVAGDSNRSSDIFLHHTGAAPPSDTTAPSGSILIAYGDVTNSPSVMLFLTCSDTSWCSHMCISNTPSCSSWEPYVEMEPWTMKPWTLQSGDGPKTVYVWFRDGVGNENTTPYSDDVLLDTLPPTGSITINSGTETTDSLSVTLEMSCTDASACTQMCISNTSSCDLWEPYSSVKQWTLSTGAGIKNVYVWFRDIVGNESTTPISDSIFVEDNLAPVTTASPVSGTYPGSRNITLVCVDNIIGCQTTYYCLGSGCNPSIVYNGSVPISSSTEISFFSVDYANNCEPMKTETYTIDPNAVYTIRVSVDSNGYQGDLGGTMPAISADGRYVAFASGATNLVPDDTNASGDIFVHDIQTGQTTRVSVDSNGNEGNRWWGNLGGFGGCGNPAISADGRYVAFESSFSNLVPDDTNEITDIFVHDMITGHTKRVSVDSNGNQGNFGSASMDCSNPLSMSADGRYIAFCSSSNLVPDDTNGYGDIFIHDIQTGQTTRVSVDSNGNQGNNHSFNPFISADGRYVAFASMADNFVSGDTNSDPDVFVHDILTGETVSLTVEFHLFCGSSRETSISADGRYVLFGMVNYTLIDYDWGFGLCDTIVTFVRDMLTGAITQLPEFVSSAGTISANGQYVTFYSHMTYLVPGDTNDRADIFVYDLLTGETTRVSVDSNGNQGNGGSAFPTISAYGRYVAFASDATNLVSDDTNSQLDVFIHHLGYAQSADSDSDGIPDDLDGCPNDPNKVQPGICGCGVTDIDSDGDGTTDCNDGCPNDPNKVAAGVCGCGVYDTDSDSDGIADCNDVCPVDPAKTTPGICGCGVADNDSDSDGTPDCNDGCPSDSTKTGPGVCGCNIADTDGDADGIPACIDNCPANYNPDQRNSDGGTNGDVCDVCPADHTDSCNVNRSASSSIGPGGGAISSADESVTLIVPSGALTGETSISVTETGTAYEYTTNLGKASALFSIKILPEGINFLIPITIIFRWSDVDNDGKVDGTTVKEENLIITKDNVAVTTRCGQDAGCDMTANAFTFQVSSLSEFALLILNDTPIVGEITAPIAPVIVATTIVASASFADPGFLDIHTATWDWGDGTTDSGIVSESGGEGTVTGSHAYASPGVYAVTLTVTDDDGLVGTGLFQYVVVYDPDGGFVTGGGWIESPAGAYVPSPTLTGRANFGFVSKYKKGTTIPTGTTEFQFKVANLNFHSDSYEWLVVAGAKAQYKGVGTINGEGLYKFMLTAIDADVNKTDSFTIDRFRIRIWTEDAFGNESVVYDNAVDSDDDSDMTEIGGGSIVIHKK